ncbi:CHASE domain-containing protein [bacterium]|nr:CHASE domain-containing protein [bacterium]
MMTLVLGSLLSVLGFYWVSAWEERRARGEFERRAAERISAVRRTLALNQQALWSVGSLYAASEQVERHEFRAFCSSALSRRPAIVALQWAPRVPREERAAHEAGGQAQGLTGYRITEGGGGAPTSAPEDHFPVFFSEPAGGTEWRMGFDLASHPVYVDLMARTHEDGASVASGHHRLLHASKQTEGVVIFHPIYDNDAPHGAEEQRRASLEGFVVGVIRVDMLVDEALRRLALSAVRLSVYDGAIAERSRICSYPAKGAVGDGNSREATDLRWSRTVRVGGRSWPIECVSSDEFAVSGRTWLPWAVLVGGFLITGLTASYLAALRGRTARVEGLVATRTDELARSNAELEQFAYVASHDLQEPLRMVSSFLQLLVERCEGKLDADSQEFIGYAVDGSQRMQALIRGLLMYSRVGRRGEEHAPVSCEDVFARVFIDVEAAAAEGNVEVTRDALPTVMGEETELGQLLQNLISNAIKFRREKGARVHVAAARSGKEWIFAVRDNGIGIEPKYVDRIFQMFQRLHTRSEYGGTGIGLAICQKIVEHHGGRIWVESAKGEGSAFLFTLPAIKGVPA